MKKTNANGFALRKLFVPLFVGLAHCTLIAVIFYSHFSTVVEPPKLVAIEVDLVTLPPVTAEDPKPEPTPDPEPIEEPEPLPELNLNPIVKEPDPLPEPDPVVNEPDPVPEVVEPKPIVKTPAPVVKPKPKPISKPKPTPPKKKWRARTPEEIRKSQNIRRQPRKRIKFDASKMVNSLKSSANVPKQTASTSKTSHVRQPTSRQKADYGQIVGAIIKRRAWEKLSQDLTYGVPNAKIVLSIKADGQVIMARLQNASGDREMDAAVRKLLSQVRGWRFPALNSYDIQLSSFDVPITLEVVD